MCAAATSRMVCARERQHEASCLRMQADSGADVDVDADSCADVDAHSGADVDAHASFDRIGHS